MSAPAIPNQFLDSWQRLREARLWRDSLSVGLIVTALIFNGLALLDLLLRLHPSSSPVPVHYSSITGFDQLGNWYDPYSIAGFGLAVTLVNALLAIRAFGRSRVAAFLLLLGSVVVAVFALIIANAFRGVS